MKNDFKHLAFSSSRYKFAAKMIENNKHEHILELGCSDGFATVIFSQLGAKVTAIDFDEEAINFAQQNKYDSNIEFHCDNFLGKRYGEYNAVVSLDVIEHIEQQNEAIFFQTVCDNLLPDGVLVLGTPNITSALYASERSNKSHINLYDHKRLSNLVSNYFNNIFVFGMNDEIVHTGFLPMAHYLMVVAAYKKR